MNIAAFRANLRSTLNQIIRSGTPLALTWYNRPQVRIVPEDLWQQAEAALAREQEREAMTT